MVSILCQAYFSQHNVPIFVLIVRFTSILHTHTHIYSTSLSIIFFVKLAFDGNFSWLHTLSIASKGTVISNINISLDILYSVMCICTQCNCWLMGICVFVCLNLETVLHNGYIKIHSLTMFQ